MPKQFSFRKQEREIEPGYRALIDRAESVEDVRKFFERTARDFLEKVVGEKMRLRGDDVWFAPDSTPGYRLSERLKDHRELSELRQTSDLNQILKSFSERAVGRWRHLEHKHPDKTESKINPLPGTRR